jgi:hypothetical protein
MGTGQHCQARVAFETFANLQAALPLQQTPMIFHWSGGDPGAFKGKEAAG